MMSRQLRLDYYKIFIAVVKHGSFSAAAEALYLSQPAVSQAIASLESGLGLQLFHRKSRGVELTREAEDFYETILDALVRIEQAEQRLQELRRGHLGNLRIGVSDTVSRYLLPDILMSFRRQHPGIRLQIRNGTTAELYDWLIRGETDLGIGSPPSEGRGIDFVELLNVQDIFVCSREMKENLKQPVSMETLSRQRLILLDEKSETRRRLQRFFESKGLSLQADMEFSSYDLLMDYAARSLGIAGVVREFFDRHRRKNELEILPLDFRLPTRSIGYFYRSERRPSPAAAAMVKLLEEMV